jgi:hypothetical protein
VLDEHVQSLRAKCIDMQQKYEAEVAKAEDAQSTYERERAQEEVKVTMMKDEAQWMQLQLSAGLASSKISALLSDLQKAETAIQLKLAHIKDTKAAVARRLKDADGDRNDLLKFDEVSSGIITLFCIPTFFAGDARGSAAEEEAGFHARPAVARQAAAAARARAAPPHHR